MTPNPRETLKEKIERARSVFRPEMNEAATRAVYFRDAELAELLAALDLADAVKWLEQRPKLNVSASYYNTPRDVEPWKVLARRDNGMLENGLAKSLPEAVSALRKKMESRNDRT